MRGNNPSRGNCGGRQADERRVGAEAGVQGTDGRLNLLVHGLLWVQGAYRSSPLPRGPGGGEGTRRTTGHRA